MPVLMVVQTHASVRIKLAVEAVSKGASVMLASNSAAISAHQLKTVAACTMENTMRYENEWGNV